MWTLSGSDPATGLLKFLGSRGSAINRPFGPVPNGVQVVVRSFYENGCVNTSDPVTLFNQPTPATPTISANGDACVGSGATLTASGGFSSYKWFYKVLSSTPDALIPSANSQSIQVTKTGFYSVIGVNYPYCESGASSWKELTRPDAPPISGGSCTNGTTTLRVTGGYLYRGYRWYYKSPSGAVTVEPSSTTATLETSKKGSFSVEVYDPSNYCQSGLSPFLTPASYTPTTPVIYSSAPFVCDDPVELSSSASYPEYQWYQATNPPFLISTEPTTEVLAGSYYLRAKFILTSHPAPNIWCYVNSATKNISQGSHCGDGDFMTPQSALYPNPASQNFKISLEEPPSSVSPVSIYNHRGELATRDTFSIGQTEKEFDASRLPPGLYRVVVNANGKSFQYRVVVKR